MSVTIAGTTFEHRHYDQRGDVLYLSVAHYEGPPASASSTPEGHNIEYDEVGRVLGMTLTNVRWLLDRDGQVTIALLPATPARTTWHRRCSQPHSVSSAPRAGGVPSAA